MKRRIRRAMLGGLGSTMLGWGRLIKGVFSHGLDYKTRYGG